MSKVIPTASQVCFKKTLELTISLASQVVWKQLTTDFRKPVLMHRHLLSEAEQPVTFALATQVKAHSAESFNTVSFCKYTNALFHTTYGELFDIQQSECISGLPRSRTQGLSAAVAKP